MRSIHVLAVCALATACVQGAPDEVGVTFLETGCHLDESSTPVLRCPQGSVEVLFADPALDAVPGPLPAPDATACSLECLLDECAGCPFAAGVPAVAPALLPPDAQMLFRDASGVEIERVAVGDYPATPAAAELFDSAGEVVGEYVARELPDAPVYASTSLGTAPGGHAAALAVLSPCAGLTVRGRVEKDARGLPSLDGTTQADAGDVRALPPEQQRKMGFLAALANLVRSSSCPDPATMPPMMATAQVGPGPGGALIGLLAIAARLAPSVPRLLPSADAWQRFNNGVLRLGSGWRSSEVFASNAIRYGTRLEWPAGPGAPTRVLVHQIERIRVLERVLPDSRLTLATRTTPDLAGWQRLSFSERVHAMLQMQRGDTVSQIEHVSGRILGRVTRVGGDQFHVVDELTGQMVTLTVRDSFRTVLPF